MHREDKSWLKSGNSSGSLARWKEAPTKAYCIFPLRIFWSSSSSGFRFPRAHSERPWSASAARISSQPVLLRVGPVGVPRVRLLVQKRQGAQLLAQGHHHGPRAAVFSGGHIVEGVPGDGGVRRHPPAPAADHQEQQQGNGPHHRPRGLHVVHRTGERRALGQLHVLPIQRKVRLGHGPRRGR